MRSIKEKCYMCNAVATTKEHAPPKSFFPPGYRENLITVPSCVTHNNDNSKDVEYVGSFIGSAIQTQETGREHFSKVLRSFTRNPNLMNLVYENVRAVKLPDGQETGVFNINLKRFDSVIQAIAHAVYYYQFKKAYIGHFKIFGSGLISTEELPDEIARELSFIRTSLNQMKFVDIKMPQPKIFRCGMNVENSHKFIYEFVFYGGFKVHSVLIPFYYNDI